MSNVRAHLRVARNALIAAVLLGGCTINSASLSGQETAALANPPPEVAKQLDELLPAATIWLNGVGEALGATARKLTPDERHIASEAGVVEVERVRVALVEEMPMSENEPLRSAALQLGFANKTLAGGTIDHLIWLNRKHAQNRALLAHELVHIAQQERMSQPAFLRRYFTELAIMGYKRSPIEAEANQFMLRYK